MTYESVLDECIRRSQEQKAKDGLSEERILQDLRTMIDTRVAYFSLNDLMNRATRDHHLMYKLCKSKF